ncbi:hypothetical protein [Methylobacterium sp. 77]|uniref:hypothetical protein n=1 Tax=Methylobacterium sp. 77 TaxID=1101192 RepID=UPI00037180A3|nr:hypothetical protein [Methylobacterium sp. 77]
MPMTFATMACTASIGLFVCLGSASLTSDAAAQVPGPQQSQSIPAPKAATVPAAQNQTPPPPSVGRQGPQARSGDRRRRSYASCNRLSHARNLRGGVRRRFLIRCKLGYERPKPGQNPAQQSPQGRQP